MAKVIDNRKTSRPNVRKPWTVRYMLDCKTRERSFALKARPGEGYCMFCGDVVKGTEYVKGSPHWGGKCIKSNSRAALDKAISDARTTLDGKAAALRNELNAYKAQIAADYTAANRPIPPGFLTSPAQHPHVGKLRELEASADHYRDRANSVSEHALSAFYRAEAEDYEDRAAKLRAAIES